LDGALGAATLSNYFW